MSANRLPVACFALPLTDELLDHYAALIEGLPASQAEIADAMRECLDACRAWWEIPESTRTDGPRFKLRVKGVEKTIAVTPLEEQQVKDLWAVVPWPYECEAMLAAFLPVEAEADARNSAKMEAWYESVMAAVAAKVLAGRSLAEVRSKVRFHRDLLSLARRYGGGWVESFVATAVEWLMPGGSLAKNVEALNDCLAAYEAAIADGGTPPIPRPELEPTPVRDAAFHLLWHATEFSIDREPLTSDKL